MSHLDPQTRDLVRIAAAIAGANEQTTREVMQQASQTAEAILVDEVILQSYLFSGFPRALNAARTWRAVSSQRAPAGDDSANAPHTKEWERRGEKTCARVYGQSYERLRENVRTLHPALDSWMITDGYGKVLSRPELDLRRRELCIVAACAASGQQRQLHSHLHGALNSGSNGPELAAVLESITDLVDARDLAAYRRLLSHVLSRRQSPPDGAFG